MIKIVVILTLILLFTGLGVGFYLLNQNTSFFSKAGSDDSPRDVKVTNFSDNSFTVTWKTQKAVLGFVKYGNSDQSLTAIDDRDQTPKSYYTHHITLKNLTPDTLYYYKIGSGSKLFDNSGQAYQQKTTPITTQPPMVPKPIFGKVSSQDGSIPKEAIVYAKSSTGSLLSTYTKEDGNFLLTLNNARTADLTEYLVVTESDTFELAIETGYGGSLKKIIKAGQTGPINMVLTGDSVDTTLH